MKIKSSCISNYGLDLRKIRLIVNQMTIESERNKSQFDLKTLSKT